MFNFALQFAITKDKMAKKGLEVTENISVFILLLQYMILYITGSIIKIIC